MPFLVYFAVLVITIAGAALGLDALTAPPPELKQKIAADALASKPRQIPIDRPDTPAAATPSVTPAPETPATALASVAPVDETVTTPTPIASVPLPVAASPAPAAETTGAAPADTETAQQASTETPPEPAVAAETPATAVASAQAIATPAAVTSAAASNTCNVQACAAAYRSFRASDCTYQPFEGERRLCERTAQDTIAVSRPAAPRNEWTARSNSRDVELRAVERRVRELTQEEFDDRMYSRRSRRVIVVETPYGEDYVTPESYSRRWQSPGWR